MSKYLPAKGAQYDRAAAQALGETLERLGFTATPKQVVDAARSRSSPIHGMFNWDDASAAEERRCDQARNHVNHLVIVIKTDAGEQHTKAFHSVVIRSEGEDDVRGYCHMVNVAENADLTQQVIAKALAEVNGWRARYAEYQAVLGGVFRAIDDASTRVPQRAKKAKGKPKRRRKVAGAA